MNRNILIVKKFFRILKELHYERSFIKKINAIRRNDMLPEIYSMNEYLIHVNSIFNKKLHDDDIMFLVSNENAFGDWGVGNILSTDNNQEISKWFALYRKVAGYYINQILKITRMRKEVKQINKNKK